MKICVIHTLPSYGTNVGGHHIAGHLFRFGTIAVELLDQVADPPEKHPGTVTAIGAATLETLMRFARDTGVMEVSVIEAPSLQHAMDRHAQAVSP